MRVGLERVGFKVTMRRLCILKEAAYNSSNSRKCRSSSHTPQSDVDVRLVFLPTTRVLQPRVAERGTGKLPRDALGRELCERSGGDRDREEGRAVGVRRPVCLDVLGV